ncbi:MAG: hypothetical protein EXS37_04445 [Opitutus sp.]|nr:hypothetical protein [Opitutus sp.]
MADLSSKPSAPPAADRDDDVVERRTLRDYYIILRERLWIALPLALLISIGYGYKQMQAIPMYYSRATMQFEKPDTVVNIQGVVDPSVRSDIDMNTNLQVLQSNTLAVKVRESFTPAEQLILKRSNLAQSPPGTDPSTVGIDMGSMTPSPSRASFIISIAVTHRDPDAAALVANKYVDTFMQYLIRRMSGGNEVAVEFLKTQADRLRQESELADAALQKYMKDKNLISLDSSMNLVSENLRRAAGFREDAKLNLLRIDEKMKQIEAFQTENRNLLEIAEIGNHATVAPLKAQLNKLNQDMSLLTERYFEKHPRVIDKINEITVTEIAMKRAVEQAIAELRTRQAEYRQNVKTYEEE